MGIEVRKLSPDLLDDWLEFFDKVVFETSDEWEGCYCMCYHWNKEMQQKKPWNFTKADGPYNRHCAIKFIKAGKMQGYLAYVNGKVVGWVNANNREVYGDINFTFSLDEEEKKKVKSIVCFTIAPDYRGMGVATKLLETICDDALKDGYDYIEAYPFTNNEYHAYHGPQAMYEKNGFIKYGEKNGCNILRKYL